MEIFVRTEDWRIEKPTEQAVLDALDMDNQTDDQSKINENNDSVTGMAQCPRFDRCSAPICPIDKDWKERVHLKGERVCAYLRRYAKDPLWGEKQGTVPTELWLKVVAVYPQVIARYVPIKKALKRASDSPFRTVVKGEGR